MYTEKYKEISELSHKIYDGLNITNGFNNILLILACLPLTLLAYGLTLNPSITLTVVILQLIITGVVSIVFTVRGIKADNKLIAEGVFDKSVLDKKIDIFLRNYSNLVKRPVFSVDIFGTTENYIIKPTADGLTNLYEVVFTFEGVTVTKTLYIIKTKRKKEDGYFYLTSKLQGKLKENHFKYDGVLMIYEP